MIFSGVFCALNEKNTVDRWSCLFHLWLKVITIKNDVMIGKNHAAFQNIIDKK